MMAHASNLSTPEPGVGDSRVQGQPGQGPVSKKTKKAETESSDRGLIHCSISLNSRKS
jgi:hypothetical protein